jgi:FKBP-type peptidyl-prolyl cis-trans isomerase
MKFRLSFFVGAVATVLLLVGCGQKPAAVVDSTPDVNDSGVAVRTIRNGHGRPVEAGDVLTVHTTGWLYDENATDHRGEQFWTSLDSEKLVFTLGAGQMIQGWDRGLPGTLIGEVRELTIPPELGYGGAGRGKIPPNSTLVFEVELFDARSPEEAASP